MDGRAHQALSAFCQRHRAQVRGSRDRLAALLQLVEKEVFKVQFAFPAEVDAVDVLVESDFDHSRAIVCIIAEKLEHRVSANAIKRAFRKAVAQNRKNNAADVGDACIELLEQALLAAP